MKIAICVKWVPALARMKFDPETKRIVREGVPHELNSFDGLAVQWAVEHKEQLNAEITVFTMGPPPARQALVQCLAMGADRAFHLNDRAFAGSDTLATSSALAHALQREQYDLYLFGYHSLDSETAQVGPEVAEMMGLSQVTGVSKLEISEDGKTAFIERALEAGVEVVECDLPCLLSVSEGVAPEVTPRRNAIEAVEDREIPELTGADLSNDLTLFGDAGSPTSVAEIRFLESSREQRVLKDVAPEEAAREIVAYIKGRGLLKPEARQVRQSSEKAPDVVRPPEGPSVWVGARIVDHAIPPVIRELLNAAQPVADAIHGHVAAFLLGGPDVGEHAEELGHYGADVVHVAADRALTTYATGAHSSVLTEAIRLLKPYAVLFPSVVNARDTAARVAGRLRLGLTGDCIGLDVDEEGRLVQLKPAFGGNIIAPIVSKTTPYMTTIRPGLLEGLLPNPARKPLIQRLPVRPVVDPAVRVLGFRPEEDVGASELDDAWSVIAVGMGMGGPENLPALDPLVELLGATIVCTRDVVEAGWLPRQRQVGITGKSVAPALYISMGVRGDTYHMVGIQKAGTVVAVNTDHRAPIFRQADIGVVADWQSMVPALTAELRKELGPRAPTPYP